MDHFDIIVIGAGSGGVRLGRMAASKGIRVAVVESTFLGGTCVNVGCVPKKLFVYGSHYHEEIEDAAGYGWQIQKPTFDWTVLRDNKTREIERLNGIYRRLLDTAGVTLFEGKARFVDATKVDVVFSDGNSQTLSADKIVIATGSTPFIPDIPGHELLCDSADMFYLDELPDSAIVWGGGYIAVEFAGILSGLGVKTSLLYRGDLFLRGFDQAVREFVRTEVEKKGIELIFNDTIQSVSAAADGSASKKALTVNFASGNSQQTGLVLAATGRVANTANLNLSAAGVNTRENGNIIVNESLQTNIPHIYALGDVIGGMQLTPVALAEAMALVAHFQEGAPVKVDYENIPTAVFCQPNIGTVGLTEEQAREKYTDVTLFKSSFTPMKHTLSGRQEKTLMKLLVDTKSDKVIGAHMVGPEAGEIIQGIAIAIKAGATKADFDSTIGIHPTAAEEFVTMRQPV